MLSMKAPAKVNLFLEVTGRRQDGFHNISSVFQTIPFLHDIVSVFPSEELALICNRPDIPVDENNLILKAAKTLAQKYGYDGGATFNLDKNIPDGGGLGGGSSDAATALILLNDLWQLQLSKNELAEIALEIGSDVPFFLYGGVCLCEGRGEIITPLKDIMPIKVSIASPPWKISTVDAYQSLKHEKLGERNADAFITAMRTKDMDIIYNESFNRFEKTVFSFEPKQRRLHEAFLKENLKPRLSGSGSCVWFIPSDKAENCIDSFEHVKLFS